MEQQLEPPKPFEVWEENWSAFCVFAGMQTQWNVSWSGLVGLRYEALPLVLQAEGVPPDTWPEVIAGVQSMESEFLRRSRNRR